MEDQGKPKSKFVRRKPEVEPKPLTTKPEPVDIVAIEKEVRRKPGRPKGSKSGNYEYKKNKREREKANRKLWQQGILHWKLDSNQKELRDLYYNHGASTTLQWLCARQIGKSYCVTTIILEEAIRQPGIVMAYIAPKLNQAKRIVNAKMRELLEDCPKDLRPQFKSQDNKWVWANGSELYLAGTDNGNAESIRGMTINRVFVDEYCFLTDFEYVMNSIIFPTMMSVPDPLMVLISSPPKTPDHESNVWLDEAEEECELVVKTVYDCPRHTKEKIARVIKKQYHGDANCTAFRREMLCERIADTSKLVIPEATAVRIDKATMELTRPDFYTINEAFDWGVADKNAGLFGYVNFDKQILVIENELWLSDIEYTTGDIANEIKLMEKATWNCNTPINRYGDNNNPQLIIDMSILYDLNIIATKKDGLQAAVNHVRNLIKYGQIVIHPRCVNLISQLQSATWTNSNKKMFSKKTVNDEDGTKYTHHYDLIAALIYLVRNSYLEVNPYPLDYDLIKLDYNKDTHFKSPKRNNKEKDDFTKHIEKVFTVRRRK